MSSKSDKPAPMFKAVRPLSRTAVPFRWATVVPAFRPRRSSRRRAVEDLELTGFYSRLSTRTPKGWSTRQVCYHADQDAHATWLHDHATGRTPLWVCTPNVSEYATAAGVWGLHAEGVVSFRRLVVGGPVEFLTYRHGTATVHVVGSANYLDCGAADLIRTVRPTLVDPVELSGTADRTGSDPSLLCQCLHEWMLRALAEWKRRECGPWRHTSSQLSHALYRRRHATGRVVTNRIESVHALERRALAGGRASVWYYGDIGPAYPDDTADPLAPPAARWREEPGTVYRLDVSSMYPSILHDAELPVAYSHADRGPPPAELSRALEVWDAVAEVRLVTDRAEYPLRVPGRYVDAASALAGGHWRHETFQGKARVQFVEQVYRERVRDRLYLPPETAYPVGEFHTVLCGPELARALADGCVREVGDVSYYDRSREFRSFAAELYDWRLAYRADNDPVGEKWAKSLANAFGGKWAQQAGGWVEERDTPPPLEYGYWYDVEANTGKVLRYRAVGGTAFRWEEFNYKPKGFPAIFATICSHGRYLMRRIRETCPPGTVYQQDTDGLYCTDSALAALVDGGWFDKDGLGSLRVVSTHKRLRFVTPRHYRVDGRWVLAGVSGGWQTAGRLRVSDDRRDVWDCLNRGESPVMPTVARRSFSLEPLILRPRPTADGWAVPPAVSLESSGPPSAAVDAAGVFPAGFLSGLL